MRVAAHEFIAEVARTQDCPGPVYEFGSCRAADPRPISDLRPLFPGREYVGCDIIEGLGVDELRNIYSPELDRESIGTVICAELFEHLKCPRCAAEEVFGVLKPGGIAIVTTLFRFPIHDHPGDYYRFTPAGLAEVLTEIGEAVISHDPLDGEHVGVYGWVRKGP